MSSAYFARVTVLARMKVKTTQGRYFVTVTGQLRGRDLGRLERACGPALERRRAPLTVRLASILAIDEPAKAYLEHLVDRGAIVLVD